LTANTTVGEVLTRYPQSLEIFVRLGFTPLRNPVLRNTLARVITIEQACRRENIDMSNLLRELEQLSVNETAIATPLVSITRLEQSQVN
ncbi:MAG TPA: DUF1858 domain-containing protein, partial [Pyrinomonadaceae bacterium]